LCSAESALASTVVAGYLTLTRRRTDETNLSPVETETAAQARIPGQNGYGGRSESVGQPSPQGAGEVDHLT
jgi:hypothetical protein